MNAARQEAVAWCRRMQLWARGHLKPTVISAGHSGAVIRACPVRLAILGLSDSFCEELEIAYFGGKIKENDGK